MLPFYFRHFSVGGSAKVMSSPESLQLGATLISPSVPICLLTLRLFSLPSLQKINPLLQPSQPTGFQATQGDVSGGCFDQDRVSAASGILYCPLSPEGE